MRRCSLSLPFSAQRPSIISILQCMEQFHKNGGWANKGPSSQSYGFFSKSCMDVSWTIKLSTEELMLLNCSAREDSWESLGLQGDQTSPSKRKSVLNIHWKNWSRSWKLQNFGHLMWKTDSLEEILMLGKDRRQEEKGMVEDEMVGWHHWLDGHEFE